MIIIVLAVVFGLLVISELLYRKKLLRGEGLRKFIHITVGSFVAFWPFFLSYRQIEAISFAFIIGVVLSRQQHWFHAVSKVARRTWGELFFPLAIGIAAVTAPPPIIFMAAILHLSLADGFAAIVGKNYGLLHQYRVHKYTKTLAGSMTFMLISLIIVVVVVIISPTGLDAIYLPIIICLPIVATLLENLSPLGLDNLFVPLSVILILQAAGIR